MRYLGIFLMLLSSVADARAEDNSSLKIGGLVDAFVAYDLNRPSQFDRAFSIVPARHNEFNVNMLFLDANYRKDRVRGRIAFQAGTAPQALYRDEPNTGTVSGATMARHIQEAYAGYRTGDDAWLDAGIYSSHLAMESWLTKDNWLYTHSLMSDLSPYFQAGIRFGFRVNEQLTAQLHMVNGWQIISENNAAKGFGLQLEFTPFDWISFAYASYAGKDRGERRRVLQTGLVKMKWSERLETAIHYSLGNQTRTDSFFQEWWHGGSLSARFRLTEPWAVAARGEAVTDPNRVVARVTTRQGFLAYGFTVGTDYALASNMLARFEVRQLWSHECIFPSYSSDKSYTTLGVLSWSLWF